MDLRIPPFVAFSAAAFTLAATAVLPAQGPVVNQSFRSGNDLELELRYTAAEWKKADSKQRPVGELRSRTPLTIGGERVEQGSHQLLLARSGGQPQLLLVSRRNQGVSVTCKLSGKRSGGPERVSLALLPTADAAAARLSVGFAGTQSELDVSPAPRRGADDPALAEAQKFIDGLKIDRSDADWKMKLQMPPKLTFTEGKKYPLWHLRTSVGEIQIELMPKIAPMHCSSTIFLAQCGFYDGIIFHRIIPRFMAQVGCPMGNGRGNPGYMYDGEFDPEIYHDRHGTVSMANLGPGTDGSQFFITFGKTQHLDGKHTIFGRVVDGQDAVDKLEAAGTRGGQPTQELLIEESYITVE